MRISTMTLLSVPLIALSFASPAAAQVSQKGWYCADDQMSGTCNGQAACDAAWAQHLIDRHSGGGRRPPTQPRTPMARLVGTTGGFSLVGGLLGSLGTRDGVNQWQNGAIGAAGVGAVVAVATTANKIPAVVGAVVATGGGALAGKQVGDFQVSQGKEETNKRDTLMGAGVGFMTWGVGKLAIGPASPNLAPRWMGPKGKLKFVLSGRWLGIIARW
jgi:hypothetical protein